MDRRFCETLIMMENLTNGCLSRTSLEAKQCEVKKHS